MCMKILKKYIEERERIEDLLLNNQKDIKRTQQQIDNLLIQQQQDILEIKKSLANVTVDLEKVKCELYEKMEAIHYWPNQNLKKRVYDYAGYETAEYIIRYLRKVKSFLNRYDLLEYALLNIQEEGLCLEFGVYKGDSINYIAEKLKNRKIFGFDSFKGLPENWRTEFEQGAFNVVEMPKVASNVELIPGFFSDALPVFNASHIEKIAFIHMDCDLYSSTVNVFENIEDKLMAGSIIVFDEFFNYPGWKEGEYKAFQEMIERTGYQYEFLGYVETHEQVAIRIIDKVG